LQITGGQNSRKKPVLKNRVLQDIEDVTVALAIEQPPGASLSFSEQFCSESPQRVAQVNGACDLIV
jgi:hypothetical protein